MKKVNFAAHAAASLGIVLMTSGGCESSSGTAAVVAGASGLIAGAISKGSGSSNSTAAVIGITTAVITGLVTYAVVENQKHEAAEHDKQVAAEEAQKRQAQISRGEQTAIDKQNAKMAVVVGETADSQLVMIYDTKANRPVDNAVYTVKKSEIQKLESLSAVQKDALSKGDSAGEWSSQRVHASATESAPSPSQSASAPTQPSTPSPSGSAGSSGGPVASSGAVDPNNVRFGALGGEKVIFRL